MTIHQLVISKCYNKSKSPTYATRYKCLSILCQTFYTGHRTVVPNWGLILLIASNGKDYASNIDELIWRY